MLHLVLFQPEIPPNTGNIIRLCANTGATLHLVGPLGFELDDARLRRAGLDYDELAVVRVYENWQDFMQRSGLEVSRLWAFTTRAERRLQEGHFERGDGLLFGPESRGLPEWLLQECGQRRCLRIPMRAGSRSLNLSNSAAVGLYEALRQLDFAGLA